MFDFITWLRKQIERSKRGTAVDQWGWDGKEMWTVVTFCIVAKSNPFARQAICAGRVPADGQNTHPRPRLQFPAMYVLQTYADGIRSPEFKGFVARPRAILLPVTLSAQIA